MFRYSCECSFCFNTEILGYGIIGVDGIFCLCCTFIRDVPSGKKFLKRGTAFDCYYVLI